MAYIRDFTVFVVCNIRCQIWHHIACSKAITDADKYDNWCNESKLVTPPLFLFNKIVDIFRGSHMDLLAESLAFVRGIHQSSVNSPYKGQRRGALMFSLICTRTNGWVNNRYAGHLRCHCAHYAVTVMITLLWVEWIPWHSTHWSLKNVTNFWLSRLIVLKKKILRNILICPSDLIDDKPTML